MIISMTNESQSKVTLTLDDVIWCILGDSLDGLDCASIPHSVAAVLEHHLSTRLTHKIQYVDEYGSPYPLPRLWRYKDWLSSIEKWETRRNYSEQQRIERWILDKNVSIVSRAVARSSSISVEAASPLAYKLVKKGNMEVLAFFGVEKLVTCEEEL